MSNNVEYNYVNNGFYTPYFFKKKPLWKSLWIMWKSQYSQQNFALASKNESGENPTFL